MLSLSFSILCVRQHAHIRNLFILLSNLTIRKSLYSIGTGTNYLACATRMHGYVLRCLAQPQAMISQLNHPKISNYTIYLFQHINIQVEVNNKKHIARQLSKMTSDETSVSEQNWSLPFKFRITLNMDELLESIQKFSGQ